MTKERDDDLWEGDEAGEEEPLFHPAGLYLFAWYVAWHFDRFKQGKITYEILPGRYTSSGLSRWIEIVDDVSKEQDGPVSPLVWEARSGDLTDPAIRIFGTADLTEWQYRDDLFSYLDEARSRLEQVKEKYAAGNLIKDSNLNSFFGACPNAACQVAFPDGAQMVIQRPKEDGILLYHMARFPPVAPHPTRTIAEKLMEKANAAWEHIVVDPFS